MRVWDVATDRIVSKIEWGDAKAMPPLATPGVTAMMLPDDNMAAKVYGREEYIRRAAGIPTYNAFSFDIDATGRRVLIGLRRMPMLHSVNGGPPTAMLRVQGHGRGTVINAVAMSPDGRHSLTGGRDQIIRLHDNATGQWLRTFEGHNSQITALRSAPDGTFALSGGHGEVRRWNLDWELGPPQPDDYHLDARPHLEAFLARHIPAPDDLPFESINPSSHEVRGYLTRFGKPEWAEDALDMLMRTLGGVGLGWIGRQAVREQFSAIACGKA